MAGSITVSSITLDSDNNFSIKSNTGATLFFANTTGIDIANSIGATAITNDKILSVANTKISGNIASSQIAPNQTLNGNVSVTGTLAVSGAVTLTTALPVLQGGTGVTTSTGTGAGVHSVGPSISSAVMTTMASSVITRGTAVATTTGTSFDFTDIPSWVKRVTIICNEVSTNGASPLLFQIGDSGGIENTGYVSTTQYLTGGSGSGSTSSTAGFVNAAADGATVVSGHMVITNISSNLWISSNTFKGSPTYCYFGGGSKTLSATLDRVRITTVNGTDAFDAGSVNILYE